ncbi:MAG: TolC family protein [Crocinitomicaceae bacterium]|nr:TolC family protein [Crocinitomicaceae bacterium]
MRAILFVLFIASTSIFAQDSTVVISYDSFIEIVMGNHPFAQRAELKGQMGEANLQESRGAFDPKLVGNINQKYFNDQQYYSKIEGGLKVPTWYGVSFNAGYSLNDGIYLNPEQRVPTNGLWQAGIEIQLGNGLIMNERRAIFEKSKSLLEINSNERIIMLSDLKKEASIAYWKWQQAYRVYNVYKQAYENAEIRLKAVKESAYFGDKPYIDTVEASIAFQNRLISLEKANNQLVNSEIMVEMFLWSNKLIPLELDNVYPEKTTQLKIFPNKAIDSTLLNHPMIAINGFNIEQREIDLKLKRESWKPKLSLKYNAISSSVNGNPINSYNTDNYNWGANFSYDILSRKARGSVQLAQLKLKDEKLKMQEKAVSLSAKIKAIRNNYSLSLSQLDVINKLVMNNETLYNSELTLFQLGESSIFMINSRESAWLNAKVQEIQLIYESNYYHSELEYILME